MYNIYNISRIAKRVICIYILLCI